MLVGEGCRAPTENAKYNIHHCFLLDPDGYQTEIQSFRNLHSNGDIQIDGTVEGDIKSRLVTVGETAHIIGSISVTGLVLIGHR